MIHRSKETLLIAASPLQPQYKPPPYGSCRLPDGGDVVQLLDGRELPIQEILGEIGANLWLVDLGEIPSYAITPRDDGCWEEVETTVV
jgi:hypothetical protein